MATTLEQIDLWRQSPSETQRLEFKEAKSAVASQVIAATIDAGLIKSDKKVGTSRKYARYVPFWA